MKKWRNFLAVFLVAALMISMVSLPAEAIGFSDIPSTYGNIDAVNYVSDNNIMVGTSATRFGPTDSLTRAMVVAVLYRKAGSPSVSLTNTFTDVSSSSYYAKAVSWATQNGIVSGTSATTFSPNSNVIRQDGMCFLYRYSKTTKTYSSKMATITGYSDYGSVSGYAQDAMRWAIGNKVLSTIAGKLYPKSPMTREGLAVSITNFGSNVERIIAKRDNLGFTNSSSNFTTTKYFMTSSHYSKLSNAYKYNCDKPELAAGLADRINNTAQRWGGSCYGMSTVAILDKLGKIAFNENYFTSNTMYGVTALGGTARESAINYYHDCQRYLKYGTSGTSVSSVMDICRNAEGPILFSYWWNEITGGKTVRHGHTVVVNSCTLSNGVYTLKVINPNATAEQTMTLNSARVLTTPTGKITLAELAAKSIFPKDEYKNVDIDGETNVDSGYSYAASQVKAKEEYSAEPFFSEPCSVLEIKLAGNYTIWNSENQYLSWNESGLNGTMPILDSVMIANGESAPAEMLLYVPASENFTFETKSSEKVWFSVSDSLRYARISGSGLEKAVLKADGVIELEGEQLDFGAAYLPMGSLAQDSSILFTLEGSGTEKVKVEYGENEIKAEGLTGEYTVRSIDTCEGSVKAEQVADASEVRGEETVPIFELLQ